MFNSGETKDEEAERGDVAEDGGVYPKRQQKRERIAELPRDHARFGDEFTESGAAVCACARNQGRIRRTRLGSIALPKRLDAGNKQITPLVGDIVCGQPSFAEENIEASYALGGIFREGELFMLHTHGDSMIDAGIREGDLIVVRKQNTADDGQM